MSVTFGFFTSITFIFIIDLDSLIAAITTIVTLTFNKLLQIQTKRTKRKNLFIALGF